MASTTKFESLFPLLTLHDSYVSPCEASLNGPRYAATDRTTTEAFEIRCVPITRLGASYTNQQVQALLEQCKKRADQLVAAKASVGHHHSTFVFPDDVYHNIEKLSIESSRVSRMSQQHITCVSVTARGGYSLQDVMNSAAALGREASHSEAPQDFDAFLLDKAPPVLSERAFGSILKAVENYCSVHLTLPLHGNLTCHAVVLKSPANTESWAIGDWLLDPQQLPAASSIEQGSKLSEMLTVQRKCVALLRRAFLGGNLAAASRTAVVYVRRPNGTSVPLEEIDNAITKAANTWHHQTLEMMRATLSSQSNDAQARDCDDACWSDSSSDASTTSAQDRAQHHIRLLAQERIQAAIDARGIMAARNDDFEQCGEDPALRSPTGGSMGALSSMLPVKQAAPDATALDLPPLKRRVLGPGAKLDIYVEDNSVPTPQQGGGSVATQGNASPSSSTQMSQRPPPPPLSLVRARGATPLLDVFPKVASPERSVAVNGSNKTYYTDGIVSTVIEEVVLVQVDEPQQQPGAAVDPQRSVESCSAAATNERNLNFHSKGTASNSRNSSQSSCCSLM